MLNADVCCVVLGCWPNGELVLAAAAAPVRVEGFEAKAEKPPPPVLAPAPKALGPAFAYAPKAPLAGLMRDP